MTRANSSFSLSLRGLASSCPSALTRAIRSRQVCPCGVLTPSDRIVGRQEKKEAQSNKGDQGSNPIVLLPPFAEMPWYSLPLSRAYSYCRTLLAPSVIPLDYQGICQQPSRDRGRREETGITADLLPFRAANGGGVHYCTCTVVRLDGL